MRLAQRLRILAFCVVLSVFSVFLLPAFSQTNADRVASITSALRGRDFAKALELLQPALRDSPNNPQLLTLQGIALSGEKRDKDALAAFRGALKISPDYLPALEGAAQIEYEADSQDAVPLLQRLLRIRPDDPTSHAMLAALAYRRGDCATAIKHFDQSGPLLDSQPATLQEYGACLVKLKQLEKAIAVFQKALASNPDDAHARYRLAAVQLMAERPQDTIKTLGPSLAVSNVDANTLELASSAYEASGDTLRAVQTLRQAIVNDPRNVDLYLDFANISMSHQSFQVGIDMMNAGLTAQPQSAPLYVARGVLYVQLARYDEAEADFEKANALDPRASVGSAAQGLEAVQQNDPDRALAAVRSKLATAPNNPFLLYLQADILAQKGTEPGSPQFEAGMASAKKAVALQPTMAAARDVLAKLYLQEGHAQAAIEESRKALDSDPKDQTALYRLIQALRRTGENNEIPGLLKRLADLRAQSTQEEAQHNRYKLVEDTSPSAQ
jgi:tetratricopeptide (TPR) repeat protein